MYFSFIFEHQHQLWYQLYTSVNPQMSEFGVFMLKYLHEQSLQYWTEQYFVILPGQAYKIFADASSGTIQVLILLINGGLMMLIYGSFSLSLALSLHYKQYFEEVF